MLHIFWMCVSCFFIGSHFESIVVYGSPASEHSYAILWVFLFVLNAFQLKENMEEMND